jgi:hypothetical protein
MSSLVRITEIAKVDPPAGLIHNWFIDSPRDGALVEADRLEVSGWVIAADVPAVALEIKNYGLVVRRAPINRSRPDVSAAFPDLSRTDDSGFHTAISLIGAAPAIDLELNVLLADQRTVPMARVRGERTWRGADKPIDEALVSVVIPAHNQAHFLRNTLDSVMGQTHPHIEVVVVDDGSSDNAAAISVGYPGVRCIRQENQGVAAARNTGIRHTVGDFLVFLDADDRLLPQALEMGLKAFAAKPECGYVFGDYIPIAHDGSALQRSPSPGPEGGYLDLLRYSFIPIHAAMFRRAVFEGGRGFDPTIWVTGAGSDWDLLLTGMREYPVYGHPSVICEYRRHSSSQNRDAGLILRSELAVLRRHRAAAREVTGGRQAHRAGVRRCKSHHGPLLTDQVRAAIAKHEWARALSGASTLARYYPRGLLRLFARPLG